MGIENCSRCGGLFHKTIKDICPTCVQKIDEDYKKVRMYIKRHKAVEMKTVSEETGVELELIHQFLQEGRIVLGEGTTSGYPCKQCGSSIQAGSLCENCASNLSDMQRTLQTASNAQSTQSVGAGQVKKGAFHARD